jgi:hypothetical protein
VTVPSWSSVVERVAVGVGQVVGSAQLNSTPWRRGRLCCLEPVVRVGVEAAARAQPHQHRHRDLGQVQGELGGVIAAIEDEQWHRWREACQERTDLAGGNLVGVLGRVQPGRVDRGGPRIAVDAELADPLAGPAGDDRLTGRMPGGW